MTMDGDAEPYLPIITDLNRRFWDGCAAGELRLQRCEPCGHLRYPISDVCPRCLSGRFRWQTQSGMGAIQSWVVYRQRYHPSWSPLVPYNLVLVQLAEGPRMIGNVDPLDRTDLAIGSAVRVTFASVGGGIFVPRWTVVDGGPAAGAAAATTGD